MPSPLRRNVFDPTEQGKNDTVTQYQNLLLSLEEANAALGILASERWSGKELTQAHKKAVTAALSLRDAIAKLLE